MRSIEISGLPLSYWEIYPTEPVVIPPPQRISSELEIMGADYGRIQERNWQLTRLSFGVFCKDRSNLNGFLGRVMALSKTQVISKTVRLPQDNFGFYLYQSIALSEVEMFGASSCTGVLEIVLEPFKYLDNGIWPWALPPNATNFVYPAGNIPALPTVKVYGVQGVNRQTIKIAGQALELKMPPNGASLTIEWATQLIHSDGIPFEDGLQADRFPDPIYPANSFQIVADQGGMSFTPYWRQLC